MVWVLCAVLYACVFVCFGGCCVLCPCACMWSVCAWGMCVPVCVRRGVYGCLCVCVWLVWLDGVRVRLRCDGLGLVAVAWTRVCMCVCRGCDVLLVRVFLFVCVVVFCCVCGMSMCGLLVYECVRVVWGGVACGNGVVWECACACALHWDSVVVIAEAAWCGGADAVWLLAGRVCVCVGLCMCVCGSSHVRVHCIGTVWL